MTRLAAALSAFLLIAPVLPVGGQSGTAIVTGTERVYVRRGPANDAKPLASLSSGSTVEVQEMEGDWARIITASGQVGYIHAKFLSLPGLMARPTPFPTATRDQTRRPSPTRTITRTRAPATPTRSPRATRSGTPTRTESPARTPSVAPTTQLDISPAASLTPTSTPPEPTATVTRPMASPTSTATSSPAPTDSATPRRSATRTRPAAAAATQGARGAEPVPELAALQERNRDLELEVIELRQLLAEVRQAADLPMAVASGGVPSCPEEVRHELTRLAAAIDLLQQRRVVEGVEGTAPVSAPTRQDPDGHALSPMAVFLGALGTFVGWWLGSRHARRQERSRRSRLRL